MTLQPYPIGKYKKTLLVAAFASVSQIAIAQTFLEEVVVTAQKREQNLQDVGISVAALGADDLRNYGIKNATEIAEVIPNVQLNTAGGSGNQIFTIRGIGLNDYSLNNTPTAAVHVDEVYMSTNAMTGFSLYDLERVEVLKGPQGTLYGRNSTAGVVNFITRKPTQEKEAYLEGTVGNWETFNVEGAIGGGLTETLSARASFRSDNRMDGFQKDRVSGSSHGEQQRFAARVQFQWDFDTVSALLNVHGGKDESDEWLPQFEGTDDGTGGICSSAMVGQPDPRQCSSSGFGFLSGAYSDTDGDPYAGDYSYLAEVDDTSYGTSLRLEFELGSLDLLSLTAYEYYDYNHGEDTDGMPDLGTPDEPFIYLDRTVGYKAKQFSQEFRLSSFDNESFNWLVGVFMAREDGEANELYVSDFLVDGEFITDRLLPFTYDQEGKTASVFGHAEWAMSEAWKLTVGARYAYEEKEWDGEFRFFLPSAQAEDDWSNNAFRLGLDFFATEDVMLYGTVSTGFKAGGIPGAPPTSGLAPEPYDSETVTAYELGFKSTIAAANLQINGSMFFYDYEDMQAIVKNDPSDIAETLNNFGDAEVKGGELDVLWLPGQNTTLKLGLGFLDTKITEAQGAFLDAFGIPVNIEGNELAHSPKLSGNFLARHVINVGSSMELGLQADLQYKQDYYLQITNDPSFAQNDDVTVVGARINLSDEGGKWDAALWGKNLTDEEYRQYGIYSLDNRDHIIYYNMPRSYGVTVNYNFY
ncbi:MAG: TonB-dependent receptor [Halioglobus sp.]